MVGFRNENHDAVGETLAKFVIWGVSGVFAVIVDRYGLIGAAESVACIG